MIDRNRVFGAVGVALAISALACAALLVRRSNHELDRMSQRLVELAQEGNPRAVRALQLAIHHKPVAYSENLFGALRSRCHDRCDGLEALLLASFDRIAGAGRLSKAWPDRVREPLRPRYRTSGDQGLMVAVGSGGGTLRSYLDSRVARVLVANLARAPSSARGIHDVAMLPEVGRALCLVSGGPSEPPQRIAMRRGFCALGGVPTGDVDALCEAAEPSRADRRLEGLTTAERLEVSEVCASLGSDASSGAFLPPNLAMFGGPSCFEVEEAELLAAIHPDLGRDAELLQASLECMGLSAEPPAASARGPAGERLWFFGTSAPGEPDRSGEWVKPGANSSGWSFRYDVTDARSNAENSAHVGEPGYVAVYAIEPAPGTTGAVSVVATSIDGSIAHIIVEFTTDPEEVDFEVLHAVGRAIAEAIQAAIRTADPTGATRAAYEKAHPTSPPSPTSSPAPSPSNEDPSPTPSEPTPSPTDVGDRAFGGPSSKSSACQTMASIIAAGPGGVPRRGLPEATRPPADPRSAHPRGDEQSRAGSACDTDRTPRSCGAVDCSEGLHLDPVTCACAQRRPPLANLAQGCLGTRCVDGSHAQAVGPGCVCVSEGSSELSRPVGREGSWERGWGARQGRP